MEPWNCFDSTMNEEVAVQIVFPMLSIQRFIKTSRKCTMEYVLHELKKMDDLIDKTLECEHPFVFDAQGRIIDGRQKLSAFGEARWIQLFVL